MFKSGDSFQCFNIGLKVNLQNRFFQAAEISFHELVLVSVLDLT